MNIKPVRFYTPNYSFQVSATASETNPSFGAASDLTLSYMYKKHSALMPKRVLESIEQYMQKSPVSQPTLEELHHKVYAGLLSAKTLDEAKQLYPEFSEVKDSAILKGNRSLAVKAIEKHMPIEDFSLAYLKDLYSLKTENELVKKYGFTNRSILHWLNLKLNIDKPKTNYHKLVNMSNEEKNLKVAEATRQALLRDPDTQKKRLEKAAQTHKTEIYREKKRQEMIDFYKREPAAASRVRQISQMTWDRCPQIKAALTDFTSEQDGILKRALNDRSKNGKITPAQKRMISGYYKRFWDKYPEFKEQYRQARIEVIEELKKQGLVL